LSAVSDEKGELEGELNSNYKYGWCLNQKDFKSEILLV